MPKLGMFIPASVSLFILVIASSAPFVFAQADADEPRPEVFIFGSGTLNRTIGIKDVHDETMELAKQIGGRCPAVIVTLDRSKADYAVILTRESKRKRGLIRTNSQMMVVNREGRMVNANNTHLVSSAAHDACSFVEQDWKLHGRIKSDGSSFLQSASLLSPGASGLESTAATVPMPASLPFDLATVPSPRTLQRASTGAVTNGSTPANTGQPSQTTVPQNPGQHPGTVTLAPQMPSAVQFFSDPSGADIQVDNAYVGSTPSTVPLSPGEHKITIVKHDFRPWQKTITVTSGVIRVDAYLERISATAQFDGGQR